jgi:tripartite ATP-independent transporter DctP family solute receptor
MRDFGTKPALIGAVFMMLLGMTPGFAAGQVELKLAHVTPTNNPYHLGADFFARRVAELTQGKVTIKIFPDAQLGNEKDLLEGLRLGTLQLAITANAPMSQFFPKVLLLDLPFIFRDNSHWAKVVDGPIGTQITGLFPQKGFRALAIFDGGWRSPYDSKRPIAKIEDVKGLKFRTMESPLHISIYRALGAQAVPMGSSEVYSALQQGVVDGGDSPPVFYEQLKHYEVAKQLKGQTIGCSVPEDFVVGATSESNISHIFHRECRFTEEASQRPRKVLVDEEPGHLADRAYLLGRYSSCRVP